MRAGAPMVTIEDARQWYLGLPPRPTAEACAAACARLAGASEGPSMGACGLEDTLDALYAQLHARCMVGDIGMLNAYLTQCRSRIGDYALAQAINHPLHCPALGFGVTPLLCAAMWNRGGRVLRLLYTYGARVDVPDAGGMYAEERLPSVPYVDHLASARGAPARFARRMSEDVAEGASELARLAGEKGAGSSGWCVPPRVLSLENRIPGQW